MPGDEQPPTKQNAALPAELTAVRPCGGCTACCMAVAVAELHKPHYVACAHQAAGGCGVYGQRPAGCRAFECLYTAGYDDQRPDQGGVLFVPCAVEQQPALLAYETRPDAMATQLPRCLQMLERLEAQGKRIETLFLIRYGTDLPTSWRRPESPIGWLRAGNIRLILRKDHEADDLRAWHAVWRRAGLPE